MNIVYITLWKSTSGLFRSTVVPSLRILDMIKPIKKTFLFSLADEIDKDLSLDKIVDRSVKPGLSMSITIFKVLFKLIRLQQKTNIHMVICRGSQAGAIGLLLKWFYSTPFVVESFEPHAQYMLDSGVWKRYGIKYQLQHATETLIKQNAKLLLCVSKNYCNELIQSGISKEKVRFVPCPIDSEVFHYSFEDRVRAREELGINEKEVVAIYAGKFGGIYHGEESFHYFESVSEYFKMFTLIIITEQQIIEILAWAKKYKVNVRIIERAQPKEISKYLSAADFGFTNVKPGNSKRYCCPIKNGEYFSNGLPIVVEKEIGDDSDSVISNNLGIVINKQEPLEYGWMKIHEIILSNDRSNSRMRDWALKNRSLEFTENIYRSLFEHQSKVPSTIACKD